MLMLSPLTTPIRRGQTTATAWPGPTTDSAWTRSTDSDDDGDAVDKGTRACSSLHFTLYLCVQYKGGTLNFDLLG